MHTNYFLLVANICTDYVHRLTDISILSSCVLRPLGPKIRNALTLNLCDFLRLLLKSIVYF